MSSGSPESGPEEITKSEHDTLGTSEQRPASAAGKLSGSSKASSILVDSDHSVTSDEEAGRRGTTDGALLREVRSSLQTISNGVNELATTVQDVLGLSDSESNASGDYNFDSQGRREFSWDKLKCRARQRRLRRRRKLNHPPISGTTTDSYSDDEPISTGKTIPDIRDCNFPQFQSQPSRDRVTTYCVDVLIAGDSLPKEIRDFKEIIGKLRSGEIQYWKPDHVSDREQGLSSEDTGKKWIQRIRINSPAVMETLRHLRPAIQGLRRSPLVFHRPFQLLVSLHGEMKEQLTNSMEKVGSEESFAELECFVNFMENRIMPDARRYRAPSYPLPETIRYDDLWYLYKPGDLVYVRQDPSGRDRFRSTAFSQRILRIIQTSVTRQGIPAPLGLPNTRPWSILGHFIEHDGTSFAPVHVLFPPFAPFGGEAKVTELPAYPISYLEDEQVLVQAQADGETYVSLIERRFGFYSGWTQTVDPMGAPLMENSRGGRLVSPEHIESDILVDFQETFNALPNWRPWFYQGVDGNWKYSNRGSNVARSKEPFLYWDEMGRPTYDQYDREFEGDETERVEAQIFLNRDSLGQFRRSTTKPPTGTFLALLPRRFFGYAVLERKFVQLSTRFVRSADLEATDKAFEKLEINRSYKQLILALVKSHFDKIETERKTNVEIETQDLIRGKGKGVVILLHGVPGVDKTATAEAVALKWKKPLFPITCGDLGYTAEALEKSLNEIFRLAHHWGCILLLDEADVFITQRERHDLKRNALVSGKCRKRCRIWLESN